MSSMNLCELIKLSNTGYEKEKIYKSRKHRGSITSRTHFGFKP